MENDKINFQNNSNRIYYIYKHTSTPGSYKFYNNDNLVHFAIGKS